MDGRTWIRHTRTHAGCALPLPAVTLTVGLAHSRKTGDVKCVDHAPDIAGVCRNCNWVPGMGSSTKAAAGLIAGTSVYRSLIRIHDFLPVGLHLLHHVEALELWTAHRQRPPVAGCRMCLAESFRFGPRFKVSE